jgi:hypothetical protein
MHLFFLGVMKAMTMNVERWCSGQKCGHDLKALHYPCFPWFVAWGLSFVMPNLTHHEISLGGSFLTPPVPSAKSNIMLI